MIQRIFAIHFHDIALNKFITHPGMYLYLVIIYKLVIAANLNFVLSCHCGGAKKVSNSGKYFVTVVGVVYANSQPAVCLGIQCLV